MATAAKTALQELEDLRQRVRQAEERVQAFEREQRGSARRLEQAFAPLRSYYEALGAGEQKPDAKLEAKLLGEAQAVKGSVVYSPQIALRPPEWLEGPGGLLGRDLLKLFKVTLDGRVGTTTLETYGDDGS